MNSTIIYRAYSSCESSQHDTIFFANAHYSMCIIVLQAVKLKRKKKKKSKTKTNGTTIVFMWL